MGTSGKSAFMARKVPEGGARIDCPRTKISRMTIWPPQCGHLLQADTDIRTVRELLDHSEVSTTMFYTHLLRWQPGEQRAHLMR